MLPLSFTARAYRKTLAHYLNLIIPKEAFLLEIGCGSGFLLQQLAVKNKVAIDAEATAVASARELNPGVTIHMGRGESFLPDNIPNYILLADTLNHVEDVQAVLAQVRSYTEPSARLIISCYNTLWRPLLALVTSLGLRLPQKVSNWLSRHDLKNLKGLAERVYNLEEARIPCPI